MKNFVAVLSVLVLIVSVQGQTYVGNTACIAGQSQANTCNSVNFVTLLLNLIQRGTGVVAEPFNFPNGTTAVQNCKCATDTFDLVCGGVVAQASGDLMRAIGCYCFECEGGYTSP